MKIIDRYKATSGFEASTLRRHATNEDQEKADSSGREPSSNDYKML